MRTHRLSLLLSPCIAAALPFQILLPSLSVPNITLSLDLFSRNKTFHHYHHDNTDAVPPVTSLPPPPPLLPPPLLSRRLVMRNDDNDDDDDVPPYISRITPKQSRAKEEDTSDTTWLKTQYRKWIEKISDTSAAGKTIALPRTMSFLLIIAHLLMYSHGN